MVKALSTDFALEEKVKLKLVVTTCTTLALLNSIRNKTIDFSILQNKKTKKKKATTTTTARKQQQHQQQQNIRNIIQTLFIYDNSCNSLVNWIILDAVID